MKQWIRTAQGPSGGHTQRKSTMSCNRLMPAQNFVIDERRLRQRNGEKRIIGSAKLGGETKGGEGRKGWRVGKRKPPSDPKGPPRGNMAGKPADGEFENEDIKMKGGRVTEGLTRRCQVRRCKKRARKVSKGEKF